MPAEVITDRAPAYPAVLEEFLPAAWHRTDQYANNRVECDHGLVQNMRRGHYELAVEEPVARRLAVAFDELARAI